MSKGGVRRVRGGVSEVSQRGGKGEVQRLRGSKGEGQREQGSMLERESGRVLRRASESW